MITHILMTGCPVSSPTKATTRRYYLHTECAWRVRDIVPVEAGYMGTFFCEDDQWSSTAIGQKWKAHGTISTKACQIWT